MFIKSLVIIVQCDFVPNIKHVVNFNPTIKCILLILFSISLQFLSIFDIVYKNLKYNLYFLNIVGTYYLTCNVQSRFRGQLCNQMKYFVNNIFTIRFMLEKYVMFEIHDFLLPFFSFITCVNVFLGRTKALPGSACTIFLALAHLWL